MVTLNSEKLDFDHEDDVQEHFFRNNWTDGLPIVPPTPEKVSQMLNEVKLEGSEVIGFIPERNKMITVEKLAINAVMAGCLPTYMPVVLAAMQGVLDPDFGVHGPTSSTGGGAIFIVVNGPITEQIGLNNGKRLLSSWSRANATIGRAVMLTLYNAGGAKDFDQSTIGHPGKVSYVMAEQEREGWVPLHVEKGFKAEDNTVTVIAAESPNQVFNQIALNPEGILDTFVDRMTALGTFHMRNNTQCALIICPEHMNVFLAHGWDKKMIKDYIFKHARRPKKDLHTYGLQLKPEADDEKSLTAIPDADSFVVLSGGGAAGGFSAFIPGWGSIDRTRAISTLIDHTQFT